MSETLLILQHGGDGPPGILADWAQARDIPVHVHDGEPDTPYPALSEIAAIATLGSQYQPGDTHIPDVGREHDFLAAARDQNVAILGLCFGGQMLASVLGADIESAPAPELGWCTVTPVDGAPIAPGPWLQWHFYRFTLAPGATALAHSPIGLQAFAHGRHLGVQFHPEATVEVVRQWAQADAEHLAELGIEDGPARLDASDAQIAAARDNAFQLFDAFWERRHQ